MNAGYRVDNGAGAGRGGDLVEELAEQVLETRPIVEGVIQDRPGLYFDEFGDEISRRAPNASSIVVREALWQLLGEGVLRLTPDRRLQPAAA
jgi:hypothetical protein